MALAWVLAGCLNFGDDIETTSPSPKQVSGCAKLMYLNPNIKIDPMGLKIIASGIDDIVWFKFETRANIKNIFNAKYVDVSNFSKNEYVITPAKNISWWIKRKKLLLGGQIELPNVKNMNVGIEQQKNRNIVYIVWHEM